MLGRRFIEFRLCYLSDYLDGLEIPYTKAVIEDKAVIYVHSGYRLTYIFDVDYTTELRNVRPIRELPEYIGHRFIQSIRIIDTDGEDDAVLISSINLTPYYDGEKQPSVYIEEIDPDHFKMYITSTGQTYGDFRYDNSPSRAFMYILPIERPIS